jgi:hypothetical protein
MNKRFRGAQPNVALDAAGNGLAIWTTTMAYPVKLIDRSTKRCPAPFSGSHRVVLGQRRARELFAPLNSASAS